MFLRDFTLGLDNLGCRTTDLFGPRYDPELASRSVISFGRLTGQDAIVGCVHSPAFIAEHFGGEMKYPENGVPMVTRNPFSSPSDLDRTFGMPDGKARDAIEAYHLTSSNCNDMAIIGNITGPLTKVSVLMGMETLSLALDDDPDFVRDVIEIGTGFTEDVISEIEEDIDAVFIASATDNPSLFGEEAIEGFSIPYLEDIVSGTHERGLPCIWHPHGDFESPELIRAMLSTGVDGFQFAENNDPERICGLIGDGCVIMGGTDIVPTLYSGSKDEIRSETDRYLDACSKNRYIFTCSCSLHRGVPLENVLEMCRCVRRPR